MSEEMEIAELEEMIRQRRNAVKIALEHLDFHVANELNEEARKLQEEIERRRQHGESTV
ncbi:MAG: hypothetical protein IJT43_06630 [Stomatobaculum sp.]|nr:hypothetical protein [Stomatobaculum sp.]